MVPLRSFWLIRVFVVTFVGILLLSSSVVPTVDGAGLSLSAQPSAAATVGEAAPLTPVEPSTSPVFPPSSEPTTWPTGEASPVTREVRVLRPGTSQETNVYIIRGQRPGPTVMIVGGVHGDERSGWMAAREMTDWTIDAGTLVLLPEANRSAIRRGRRTGADGVDLNRQFPLNRTPRTALAREIWAVVREFKPVALLDMHEGWGIWGRHNSVGQTVLVYPAGDARSFANYVARYQNTYHVNDRRTYSFRVTGPPIAGSLARKAGAELRIPAFIVESTAYRTRLTTRIRWQKVFAEEFLRWYGLIDRPQKLVPKQYRVTAPLSAGEAVPLVSPQTP